MIRPRKSNEHDYSILIKKGEPKTREDYEKLSEEKLEDIIYCGEMSIAR